MVDFEKLLEILYWEFDARRSGYAKWERRPQTERDAFKGTLRRLKPNLIYATHPDNDTDEVKCAHLILDELGVPRKKGNIKYSLVGRIRLMIQILKEA